MGDQYLYVVSFVCLRNLVIILFEVNLNSLTVRGKHHWFLSELQRSGIPRAIRLLLTHENAKGKIYGDSYI